MIQSMYIALGQGQTIKQGQNSGVHRKGSSLWSFVASFKKSLHPLTLYTSFHKLINVYSRRSGTDNPMGHTFYVNINLLSLRSFATSLKTSLWSLISYTFFHDFIHVYSPAAGTDNPLGMKFWCQQEHQVPKTKSLCSYIYIFFMILHMYITPGQEQTAPRGQNFNVNRKA